MKTATERKQEERNRKREAGLLLKQVWVPPDFWPVIQDLTTREAEAFVFAKSYQTRGQEQSMIAYTYELARELWLEVGVNAAVHDMNDAEARRFGKEVLRAMIKTMPDTPRAPLEMIEAAKAEMFGEENAD